MTNTNHPNAGLSLLPSIFLLSAVPIKIPIIAKAEIVNRNCQLIAFSLLSPKKPISDLAAIIASDVPIASFIGNLLKITKAGIIQKPPPAPTRPVTTPTIAPSIKIIG